MEEQKEENPVVSSSFSSEDDCFNSMYDELMKNKNFIDSYKNLNQEEKDFVMASVVEAIKEQSKFIFNMNLLFKELIVKDTVDSNECSLK